MPSTHTSNLNLEKPADGEQGGEWGTTINSNMELIDAAVATKTGAETLTNKTLTSPVLNTGVSGTAIKDEDNMTSDSASHLATQQSIKAYVDSQSASEEEVEDIVGAMTTSNTETGIAVTYQDADGTLDFVVSDTTVAGDSGSTGITPGDTLTIAGGANITTAMSGDTLTITGSASGAVADLDIDGATDIGEALVDADLFIVDNGANGTNRKSALSRLKTYVTSDNTLTLYKFTATSGQTTFTGNDDSATSLAYTAGALFVTLNGSVLENGTDYTATNGTSVVLTDAAALSDELNVYAFGTFNVATVTGASGDFSIADDLSFTSDAAVVNFGVNSDVTLTHVHDTGLLLNGAMQLQFNDASQNITAPNATTLDINATDEVEINATLADVNANLDVSGTYTGGGTMTTGGNIVIPNDGSLGSVGATSALQINSAGEVGIASAPSSTAALYVYNNEESHYVGYFKQDNASSTTNALYSQNDGTGAGLYGYSAGIGTRGYSTGSLGVYGQSTASHGGQFTSSAGYGVYGKTTSSGGHGGVLGYDDGSTYCILGYSPSSTAYSLYGNGAGYLAGTLTENSDGRLKDIQRRITTSDGILEKINQLQPTYYCWKPTTDQGIKDESEQIGFIAQEVEAVFGHLVKEAPVPDHHEIPTDADGNVLSREKTLNEELGSTKSITYQRLTVYLTAALQEASVKIDSLEARLTALEA